MLESSLGGPRLQRTEPTVPGPSKGLALLGDPPALSLLTLSRRRKGTKVRARLKGGTGVLSAPSHGCSPTPGMATLLFPPGEVAVPPPCHPPACAPCHRVPAGEARGHKELPGARGTPWGDPLGSPTARRAPLIATQLCGDGSGGCGSPALACPHRVPPPGAVPGAGNIWAHSHNRVLPTAAAAGPEPPLQRCCLLCSLLSPY